MTGREYDDPWCRPEGISPRRLAINRALVATVRRMVVCWVLRHWLLLVNLSNAATVAGAFVSPLLMAVGWTRPAGAIFASYGLICVQNPDHSYFLFDYQMALDQRMLTIYGAAALAGLAYAPLGGRLCSLCWKTYLVLIAPMAIDGFTQLFGWRHSTWELRSLTGALFGVATVWWLYPLLEREVAQMRAERDTKQRWCTPNVRREYNVGEINTYHGVVSGRDRSGRGYDGASGGNAEDEL